MTAPATWNTGAVNNVGYTETWTYLDNNGAAVPMSGWTAKMQLRMQPQTSTIALELNTTNGKLVLGATDGTVTAALGTTDLQSLAVGTYYFDIVLQPLTGNPLPFIAGTFVITQGTTR